MTPTEFLTLEAAFGDGGKYPFQEGHCRLRALGENQYELAFLVSDPCGSSLVHPQVTVAVTETTVVPLRLLDFGATPLLRLEASAANEATLEEALTALGQLFFRALK